MKYSNQIHLVARSVGLPESEFHTNGQVTECLKDLMLWIRETRMPSRMEVGIGRSEEEALQVFYKGKAKSEAQLRFNELMSEIDLLGDQLEDQLESDASQPTTTNQPAN
jgi:hypothetical protein